jgi:hypothetical protein
MKPLFPKMSKMSAPAPAEAPTPRPKGMPSFNPAGKAAFREAKQHFGDNDISRAIGQTAHEQGGY